MTAPAIANTDPRFWIGRGRSAEHAEQLAQAWRDYPDLPVEAPVESRIARGRERVIAMRPIMDALARDTEIERRRRNFAFVEAQIAAGKARDIDDLIIVGRDRHGYDWDEAVQYADGRYAAEAGWERRGPCRPLRGQLRPSLITAYNQGFSDGGGNPDDLFDAARRAIAAADRTPVAVAEPAPVAARPLPSTWPHPSDAARPATWSNRLLIMGAAEALDGFADMVTTIQASHAATIVVMCGRHGYRLLADCHDIDRDPPATGILSSSASHHERLATLMHGIDVDDILIAADDAHLRMIDADASALPLARTMERLRNSHLQRRAQMRIWIDRGRAPGEMSAAGHIRWGKAIAGLTGRLGAFSAHYLGPAAPRGHRILVRRADGMPATGLFDACGRPLDPETIIPNRSRLRGEMARILRAFAASTQLGPHQTYPWCSQ